ncbi:putative short-chain dehydrogenase reductase sdr protein [Neofusicoccum parvum UCRNP2]|uniref:Putative short-chain dehydrogenase reductase sdr protein n=1 Tax=Botryosphaeria parva (strain UCR-NP2) TaxID=1287680 RepID=R1G5K1_BOTPV|nr:putative short-chain dehydrogenase reductase sdr protein [Neofusicoccum parvum UCRNP2]
MAAPTYTKTFHRTAYPSISHTRLELSLSGKTIFITGGGSGIGTAMASTFAAAGAANILLMGRTLSRLETVKATVEASHPSTAVALYAGDVTKAADVADAFKHLKTAFGAATAVDALIANAGHLSTPTALATADPEDWWRGYEVNVKGLFNLAQRFLEVAAPGAVLVNISTMAAHAGAFPDFSGYVGSKAAAVKVMEVLQKERQDLRFVSAHPGVIETAMYKKSGLAIPCDDSEF